MTEKRQKGVQEQIGIRVQSILEEKGWSQQQLADKLGKDKGYISRIIRGEMNVTIRVIAELEQALSAKILKIEH